MMLLLVLIKSAIINQYNIMQLIYFPILYQRKKQKKGMFLIYPCANLKESKVLIKTLYENYKPMVKRKVDSVGYDY
jgi:hypothetical protein